jgi:hypothetical protein
MRELDYGWQIPIMNCGTRTGMGIRSIAGNPDHDNGQKMANRYKLRIIAVSGGIIL